MRYRNHPLRDAVVLALIASTGSLAAEQAQAQSATDLDTVVVTGTRIKSQTMTASSPVTEISAEEFEKVGATTVEELVNQYPQLTLANDNFANNGARGYSTVNLRDLGSARTLALVNGRRLPPGAEEVADISIVPPAALKRVDVLTGGASAVYGADAVAGVVNFVLDDEFQGVKANIGYSTFQHDNDNGYMQSLLDDAGYGYPDGSDSSSGTTKNIELIVGGDIGDRGHVLSWLTWRENDALLQGERDYSACALDNSGTFCAGSRTSAQPNFIALTNGGKTATVAHQNDDGSWSKGYGDIYNFGPINYYQRPDTRLTAGTHITYDVNEHFQPYLEAMFLNRESAVQLAESGTFFKSVDVRCDDAFLGTFCDDLGINQDDLVVRVGKRNVEGGPRFNESTTTTYRFVTGAEGAISDYWSYDASFQFARNSESTTRRNDFLTDRVQSALTDCPPGSFDGCIPYNVWVPGGVTSEAANALAGVGQSEVTTYLKAFNGFVSGDLGFGLPSAKGDTIKLVAGYEWRETTYKRFSDIDTQTGNFTGVGAASPNIAGSLSVNEVFLEAQVPLLADAGVLDHLGAELGYRTSDYSNSGRANTFKIGLGADFADGKYRVRTGWNRAIRAPDITDLFSTQRLALFGGEDLCAGADPTYSPEQCANTGVTAAQYGNVLENSAGQYNQFTGGNPDLIPETAETWTLGVAANPLKNLNLSLDYYDITIDDAITTIGANTILNGCATTGDPTLCGLVRRAPGTGDLWLGDNAATAGQVINTFGNFGTLTARGIDLLANYSFALGAGTMSASFNGNYVLEQGNEPVPGVPDLNYDCAGIVSTSCKLPEWRHIANVGYSFGRYRLGLRWRYIGELDYRNNDGTPGSVDQIVIDNGHKIDAFNYLDLSASVAFGDSINWTVGINNIADKEPPLVGGELSNNGNALSGYDQGGRFVFTNVSFRF